MIGLLAIELLAAGGTARAQDYIVQTYGSGTPVDSWAYSKHEAVGLPSDIAYYPTADDLSRSVFQGYVVTPQYGRWSDSSVSSVDTTFVFSTTLVSAATQTLSLKLNGDDGHSVFVDDQFVAGGGFAVPVAFDLLLQAGVPVRLLVADHNAPGPWELQLTDQNGNSLKTLSGITLDASPVPEASAAASLGLLLALGLSGAVRQSQRRKIRA